MTKRITWPLLLLLLTACAAPQATMETVSGVPAASAVKEAADEMHNAAAALPGAEVGAGELLSIRYPGQVLFSEGAALPLAGGTGILEPLATFLAGHRASRWQGTVRAATGVSAEYDLQLAEKRAELLGLYFNNRGLGADRLTLRAEAGGGPAFEVVRQD